MALESRTIFVPSLHDSTLLEARVTFHQPSQPTNKPHSVKAVVISHPYGPLGGNFYNNVVVAVEEFFLKRGYMTVAFNFRGSGKSKGRNSWSGNPETGDFRAMVEFLIKGGHVGASKQMIMSIPPVNEVTIVGYSYGALIASTLSTLLTDSQVNVPLSFVFISYPLSVTWFLTLFRTSEYVAHLKTLVGANNTRVLFMYGDSDQFTGVQKYRRWVRENCVSALPNWNVREVDETDHFWFGDGMERTLLDLLGEWVDAGIAQEAR